MRYVLPRDRVMSCSGALLGAALAVAAGWGVPATGQVIEFMITLDGSQESPPVATPASGTGTATLDMGSNLFTWQIDFGGLKAPQVAAHFHGPAPQCMNAGVQVPLPVGSPVMGSATVSPEQAADILAGLWYVNVHTKLHPPGEIRGQVMPAPLVDPIPALIGPGDIAVRLEPVAAGLTAPNWGTFAPGQPDRLYVTDQNGILWSIDLGSGSKNVFLDVSDRIVDLGVFGPGSFDERGLLGVAFHPQYADNGLLYTYTSEPVSGMADYSTIPMGESANHQAVIVEWQVPDPGDPASVVDPASARVLLRIDEPQFNHNAGAVAFGPDDLLYVSLGDGGGADDKDGQGFLGDVLTGHGCVGNGQDPSNPLGSVLRIDPGGSSSANGQYGIPADNPFVGQMGFAPEIFAYGFRNPFRFSFDMASGDLFLGDVGQNDIEEIDIVTSGGNYGWNQKEGTFFFVANGNASGYVTDLDLAVAPGLVDPIAEYDHDEGIAIVGGFVYRGSALPGLHGRYVFGDFARTFSNDGRLFVLDEGNQIVEPPIIGQDALGLSLLGFGQDAGGEVYVLGNSSGTPFGETGVVLRLGAGLELDIRPGSCPNPLNRSSRGVLPVALVGTAQLNVADVDLSSLTLQRDGVGGAVSPLEGPPGPHSVLADVSAPRGGAACDCDEHGVDGIVDLLMHFSTEALVEALELDALPAGGDVELTLSGTFLDGSPFTASDCVRLVPPAGPPIGMTVRSNAADVFIELTPPDLQLDTGGFADFQRSYPPGTLVSLTAPPSHEGRLFLGWRLGPDQGDQPGRGLLRQATLHLIAAGNQLDAAAIFGPAPRKDAATALME